MTPRPLRLDAQAGPVQLRVEAHQVVTLLEIYDGAVDRPIATTLTLAPGARVFHVRLHDLAPDACLEARLDVTLAADSAYRLQTLALGGRRNHLDLAVTLSGEGAEAHLDGLAAAEDGERVVTHAEVVHAAPGARSRQLQKLLVGAGGAGEFVGSIRVDRGAVQTDAAQSSRGLLLAAGGRIDARPELMIFADDVKCAHGTAIGALDPGALFYLQARGLSEADARALLTDAFADEVIARAPEALRAGLSAAFTRRRKGTPCLV